MKGEITGNSYKYEIDDYFGINKDGFIAVGSESIVYKGLKTKLGEDGDDGKLQFPCVLKFKPKRVQMNGKTIDRLEVFKTEEWKIFEELRECRSIVRIDDVVEDLGDFSMPCDKVKDGVINKDTHFCIVEEYIDGWSLKWYCSEEYWKLRRKEMVENGISRQIDYPDFEKSEKEAIEQDYDYDNILKYQNQILLFMINLCEILEFVTGQKKILHLDIKPENIMVTKYGKELVLIDFGRAKRVTTENPFVHSTLPKVDYNQEQTLDRMYQYGTLGYAAPECYSDATDNSSFPFTGSFERGKMSIESDIFSFGATFWECLNIFELITKNEQFSRGISDDDTLEFYEKNFLQDAVYVNRDLSCTSLYYHEKLDEIIIKCTRKRIGDYTNPDNKNYYHSYKALRKEIENAKDSVPTIVREENIRAKNAFHLCGRMFSFFSVFLIIYFIYRIMATSVAESKWESVTADYNENRFSSLREAANDLMDTATAGTVDEIYDRIAGFTYRDGGEIAEQEAEMLVDFLVEMDNDALLAQRVDEIMLHADTKKFIDIATEIVRLEDVDGSIGYDLARAIHSVEKGRTEILAAYETLREYQYNVEFHSAVVKLKNVLDEDEYIKIIAEGTGLSRPQVQDFLKGITVWEDVR